MKIKGRLFRAALLAGLFFRGQRPFGRLSGQLSERLGEMLSVVQEEYPPRATLHEKSYQRGVGLGRIAVPACKDQVVGTVVSRLAPAGPNMVERHDLIACFGAAVRANGPVKGE